MNNGFSMNNGFGNRNIAGINRTPNNVVGINKGPSNVAGINKMPTMNNPFNNVKIDRQMSKQIMGTDGTNLIRNDFNKGGGFNGN